MLAAVASIDLRNTLTHHSLMTFLNMIGQEIKKKIVHHFCIFSSSLGLSVSSKVPKSILGEPLVFRYFPQHLSCTVSKVSSIRESKLAPSRRPKYPPKSAMKLSVPYNRYSSVTSAWIKEHWTLKQIYENCGKKLN